MVDVAQLVRAPVCGTGGREFESHLPPHLISTLIRKYNLNILDCSQAAETVRAKRVTVSVCKRAKASRR